MRNTVMLEKLSSALSISPSVPESAPALSRSAKGAATKKAKAASPPSNGKKLPEPRYVVPPKRANPFSVHAFPVAAIIEQEFVAPVSPSEIDQPRNFPLTPTESPQVQPIPEPETIPPKIEESSRSTPAPVEVVSPPEAVVPISSVQPFVPFEAVLGAESSPAPVESVPARFETVSASLVLPSDLSWLDKPSPFSSPLKAMVDSLRDAKTRIAFQMEQQRARKAKLEGEVKKLQDELYMVEFRVEEQREGLRRVDDIISACALVAEQSVSIDPNLLVVNGAHKKSVDLKPDGRVRYARPDEHDPTILRLCDLRKFFAANPNIKWTAKEILEQMPPTKRAHGKRAISVALAAMTRAGEIERVGAGTYHKAVSGS